MEDVESKKPIITSPFGGEEWEFQYSHDIENERISDEYWSGVEVLGYDDVEAENIFKELIGKCPYYIDAYVHLSIAFKNQGKQYESFLTAEKAYLIGKSCFPKEFKMKKHQLPWIILENRPFLRACHVLGLEYQQRKRYKEAVELYGEILAYNKGDNQGVRYLILDCLFVLKDFDQAEKILKKYDDDWGIEFVYGRLILAIVKNELDNIDLLLANASECNKFVFKQIVKTKHTAPSKGLHPDLGVVLGSAQEAYEYWDSNKEVLSDPRILSFIKKHLSSS